MSRQRLLAARVLCQVSLPTYLREGQQAPKRLSGKGESAMTPVISEPSDGSLDIVIVIMTDAMRHGCRCPNISGACLTVIAFVLPCGR
jgi:predicted metal-dependent peptidase